MRVDAQGDARVIATSAGVVRRVLAFGDSLAVVGATSEGETVAWRIGADDAGIVLDVVVP